MDGNDPRSRDKGYDRGRYPKGGGGGGNKKRDRERDKMHRPKVRRCSI